MKKTVLFLLIASFGIMNAQGRFLGHLNPNKLDSVEVTGKAVVKTIDNHTFYYLDSNADGAADYKLNFGPSWYKPVDSLAVKPADGASVTIIGGKYFEKRDSISAIVVYQINGKVWRDPYLAEWNDLADRDSLKGFFHGRKPHRGYGFGVRKDSIETVTLSGTAMVDTTFKRDRYFLNTDTDTIPNYILNFGPDWFKPASGAVRPLDGDKITVVAGILGAKSKYPMAVVYELNGKVWRDSVIVHRGVGGKWLNANNTTTVSALFDSNDKLMIGQSRFNNRMTNEFTAELYESLPENMPAYKAQSIIAAYEISLFDNKGINTMLIDGKSGGKVESSAKAMLQLHYTDEELAGSGLSENNLRVKAWNSVTNSWQLENAIINKTTNTATFESTTLSNFYIVTGSAVTGVEAESELPAAFELKQNYPNPFNPTTTISYLIPTAGNVSLKVYDILGNEVVQLVNGFQNAGSYSIKFDGKNLASGIYFYRLNSGSFSSVKKLTLIK